MLFTYFLDIAHMSGEVWWPVWERQMVRGRCFTTESPGGIVIGLQGREVWSGQLEGRRVTERSWEEDSSFQGLGDLQDGEALAEYLEDKEP